MVLLFNNHGWEHPRALRKEWYFTSYTVEDKLKKMRWAALCSVALASPVVVKIDLYVIPFWHQTLMFTIDATDCYQALLLLEISQGSTNSTVISPPTYTKHYDNTSTPSFIPPTPLSVPSINSYSQHFFHFSSRTPPFHSPSTSHYQDPHYYDK